MVRVCPAAGVSLVTVVLYSSLVVVCFVFEAVSFVFAAVSFFLVKASLSLVTASSLMVLLCETNRLGAHGVPYDGTFSGC